MTLDGRLSERVTVTCAAQLSSRCKREWTITRSLFNRTKRAGGKPLCLYCAHAIKSSGRNNPNRQYSLNDALLAKIDTEVKAYLLGWIASDGHVSAAAITIAIHNKDRDCLEQLRDGICREMPIAERGRLVSLTISSKRMVRDVCLLLGIQPGKKSDVVGFPYDLPEHLKMAFVRGVFDGDGSVGGIDAAWRRKGWPSPRCSIVSNSQRFLDALQEFIAIPCYRGKDVLEWRGVNALDFLGKLYSGASYYLPRKRDAYIDWSQWVPSLLGTGRRSSEATIRWSKTRPEAWPPKKHATSDSGYDVQIVAAGKRVGEVMFYHTGLRVEPPFGWYFDLVARSSITKTGYMLANGIGVIDRSYIGEVLVPLIKVDPAMPDLELPARVVQLVPRPIVHFPTDEVDELPGTSRGSGGFGSTGR